MFRASEVTTCEGNKLSCSFVSVDRDGERIGVENLATPTGVLKHAVMSTEDIDKIIFFPSLH